MCREEKLLGQKAEVEDDGGEEDEDEEEGGGTAAPAAAASAASDWLGGPYMLAWLKSLEKVNMQSKTRSLMVDQIQSGQKEIKPKYNRSWTFICGHIKKKNLSSGL